MVYYDGTNESEVFGNYNYHRLPSWVWKAVEKNHNIVEVHKIEQNNGFIVVRGKEIPSDSLNWVLDNVKIENWYLNIVGIDECTFYPKALFPEDIVNEVSVHTLRDCFKCENLTKQRVHFAELNSIEDICKQFKITFGFPENAKSIRDRQEHLKVVNTLYNKEIIPIVEENVKGPAWVLEKYTSTPLVYYPEYEEKRTLEGKSKIYEALKAELISEYEECIALRGNDGWRPTVHSTKYYKEYKVEYADNSSAIVKIEA